MSFVGYQHATALIIALYNFFVSTLQLRCFPNNLKGPLQYLLRPLLGKNEFAVTQHMYAFIGPNLDNIH